MAMTPEGRVKKAMKKIIALYGAQIWSFWPVQSGYGRRTVDLHMCIRGRHISIEVKRPGEMPTRLQTKELIDVTVAGGLSAWFDNAEKFHRFLLTVFPDLKPIE